MKESHQCTCNGSMDFSAPGRLKPYPKRKYPQKEYQYNRIQFWLNGTSLVADIPPAMSTLDFLHTKLNLHGTKCSCNEGDCGACTVVICSQKSGVIYYEAINSCLYPAAKLHGKHLITIEGIGTPDNLHPIQQVFLDFHATQCGYCTPGFVMSLFALLSSIQNPDKELILQALEGNLCRCTGYDSILRAATYLSEQFTIGTILPKWCVELESSITSFRQPIESIIATEGKMYHTHSYHLPQNLSELFLLMDRHANDDVRIINGGTDIMVQVNISHKKYPILIDISMLPELKSIGLLDGNIAIGAAVSYNELQYSEDIRLHFPELVYMIRRIASEQIRNFGTLSGNIANASPIGDTLPLMLVFKARLELSSSSGTRLVPISEYFLDYRKTAINPGEIISRIILPLPAMNSYIRCTKASKRKAVDISAICTAFRMDTAKDKILGAMLAIGGAAGTPKLSVVFPKMINGKHLKDIDFESVASEVAAEFSPISDVRGSAKYRHILIKNQCMQYLIDYRERLGRRS